MSIDFSQMVTAQTRAAEALTSARLAAHARTIDLINAAASAVTGPVPLAEMMSWTAKEEAARRLLSMPEGVSDPVIEAIIGGEAAVMGETNEALAARIIANADAYRSIVAHLAGLRRRTAAAIDAADTPQAVQACVDDLVDSLRAVLPS